MSHSPTVGHTRQSSVGAWIVVALLIAGALAIGGALMAGSVTLVVIGGVLIFAGLVCSVVLAHLGAAPVPFTQEFPENTYGPRGTTGGDSSPPIDTHPNGLPGSDEYPTVEEVDAESMSEPPDDRRVFPQRSNLGPDERLRNTDGHEVIERAEADQGPLSSR